MRSSGKTLPVIGITGTFRTTFPASESPGPDPFGLLVSLYQTNKALSAELRAVQRNLAGARDYLASPGCNARLAEARLLQLRAKHSAVLALLRANRVRSRDFLARLDPGPAAVPA